MKGLKRLGVLLLVALGLAAGACAPAAAPAPTPAPPAPTPTPAAPKAMVYAFVNPNKIVVIDAETNEVVRTAEVEIPGGGRWAYNDDNNYYDGKHLWVGTRNNNGAANDLEVHPLDLDTFKVAGRFRVGSGEFNQFIGKARRDGVLPVGTRDLGTVVNIDTKNMKLLDTWQAPLAADPSSGKPLYKADLPAQETVGGGKVVCDADVSVGPDGKERFYYPTQGNDLVVALDARTGEMLKVASIATGSRGNMLTTHPMNGTVWAQENQTNTQAVLHPVTLDLIARIPTGKVPFVNSFSPDGKLSYINGNDVMVTVVDTETYKVVATVQVGANATQTGAHPNGKSIYVQVTRENSVAVIDTSTWQVVRRIDLGASPNGLFVRKLGG